VAAAGVAIVVGWFLPFVHVEANRPGLSETVRLPDLGGAPAFELLAAGAVLLLAGAWTRLGGERAWPVGLALIASLVALYLVATASISFTDSPVNSLYGGPLLDDELNRIYREGAARDPAELYLRGRPRAGFWLAFAGSAAAVVLASHRLIRLRARSRKRALLWTAGFVVLLLVLFWFEALLSDPG
jgi:hypothetical protein